MIKLSAAVHQLSCTQASLPYLAMVKNPYVDLALYYADMHSYWAII